MKIFSKEGLEAFDKAASAAGPYVSFQEFKVDVPYKFRVFDGILGWRIFTKNAEGKFNVIREESKPSRIPENATAYGDREPQWTSFAAYLVYDYQKEEFRVLEISQVTILREINSKMNDDDWGDIRNYDIKLTKKEDKGRVSYEFTPVPPTKLAAKIEKGFKALEYNLDALYHNDPVFGSSNDDSDVDTADESSLDEA